MEKTQAVAAPHTPRTKRAANPRTAAVEFEVKDTLGNPIPTRPRRPRATSAPAVEEAAPAPRVAGGSKIKRQGRAPLREGQAYGRNGEVLTRNRVSGDGHRNEFDIPDSARDPNFDLMWARQSVHGKTDNANLNHLHDNGWRPASPVNYGSVMPDMKGKASIERDGLILMERPYLLSEQALDEEHQSALELREIQTEAFGNRKLPKGFKKGGKARHGNETFDAGKKISRTLERSPKEARPTYTYATPGDDE